jgi:hypothetical protein
MSTEVRFLGVSAIAGSSQQLWSYEVDADPPASAGDTVALGFPSVLALGNPAAFSWVPDLSGMFLRHEPGSSRQFAGRAVTNPGTQVINIVAPSTQAQSELLLVTATFGTTTWTATPYVTPDVSTPELGQLLPAPAPLPLITSASPLPSARPVADFAGTLPYASEVFGVYQPLAGWLGRRVSQDMLTRGSRGQHVLVDEMFAGPRALMLQDQPWAKLIQQVPQEQRAVLSPVGLVTLFREYFFEFDNFLGVPSGHIWISPGGTVEVVESSTRRTLTERTAEVSESSTYKVEESLTSQDDVADAVKEDNANDTKLGASASAGAKFAGVYHADASATFSNEATTKKSSELTHKHTRTQSSRVSSEIKRNFATTFRTLTETTDVTSRRYVVQNNTLELVNYELRRKMRKVGVQVQHVGTRLSWQVFLDSPGTRLGLGELVHVVPAPDLSSVRKPDPLPPLLPKDTEFAAPFTLQKYPGTANDPHQSANYTRSGEAPPGGITGMHSDDNDDHIVGDFDYTAPPPDPGYTIDAIRVTGAKTQNGDAQFLAHFDWLTGSPGQFRLKAQFLNFGGGRIINLTLAITWKPPAIDPAQASHDQLMAEYDAAVADIQRRAYGEAVRTRVNLVSSLSRRPSEDLRKEERHTVYGRLVQDLQLFADPHVGSELIRQIFDVDEMLYFASPDYWRPSPIAAPSWSESSVGKYPVPAAPASSGKPSADPLEGETVASRYSHTHKDNALDPLGNASPEWRIDYLVTEDSKPAPYGSSLGWLIQNDGDDRRNEFLNAAWVKAILPIRPGHELEALDWLAQAKVEGEAGLGQPYPVQPGDPLTYQGKTLGEVLRLLAAELQAANTDMANTLATETVFETGFDPLEGGFRPAAPYEVFDQWVEVLPTDQVVAVAVKYDGKSGQQV